MEVQDPAQTLVPVTCLYVFIGPIRCQCFFLYAAKCIPDHSTSRSQLNFFTNHRDNPMLQIFVFFTDEKSVKIKTMRK